MEFDKFDNGRVKTTRSSTFDGPERALKIVDDLWYVGRSRASRTMDLLGDYAGNEFFLIDGESLLQVVLDDPLLALGRSDDCSFQILHAYHTLEHVLSQYTTRGANFEIVFFHVNRHLTVRTGDEAYIVASRMLARTLLFKHLLTLGVPVHTFKTLSDENWKEYEALKKPMFLMMNDGEVPDPQFPMSTLRVLGQRMFVYEVLSGKMAMALLKGTRYADSKIVTTVYEPERQGSQCPFSKNPERIIAGVRGSLTQILRRVLEVDNDDTDLLSVDLRPGEPTEELSLKFIEAVIREQVSGDVASNLRPLINALSFANLVHFLHIPSVSMQDRSQPLAPISSSASEMLTRGFLCPVFFHVNHLLLSPAHRSIRYDFDGRCFLATLIHLSESSKLGPVIALGDSLAAKVKAVWAAATAGMDEKDCVVKLGGVTPWLGRSTLPGPPQESSAGQEVAKPLPLLPFTNPIISKHLPPVSRSRLIGVDESAQTDDSAKYLHFGGTMFSDTRHWHNQKTILPPHLGGETEKPATAWLAMKRRRKQQQFMYNLQMQAATITGASGSVLRQIVIPPAGNNKRRAVQVKEIADAPSKVSPATKAQQKPGKKAKPEKLSSKQLLLQKIQDQKSAETIDASMGWWKERLALLTNMPVDAQVTELANLSRNKRACEETVRLEMDLYRLHLEVERWVKDPEPSSSETRDKYSLSIVRLIKGMVDKKVLNLVGKEAVTTLLKILGFDRCVEGMLEGVRIVEGTTPTFKFVKLVKAKAATFTPVHDFMAIGEDPVEWQLRVFGEYMDRSMDSAPDRRVPFDPDAWQRRVLDCIDANHSILVVAPTSAGKTFISFYAMEQVLRGSDDDIIVYVAPTKALVTQIAAEIYARFSKNLGEKSCWAIHTRDYRINDPQKCQILVTVPEVLSIMLLSPPLAKVWTPRLKRIILDEIHSIGHQEGGAVWEQIILLAPCPIIGLSATIGSPAIFNEWLESVQKAHGFQHTFINHPHRYSHLRKFFYILEKKPGQFSSLSQHETEGNIRFIHPMSALSFGRSTIPDDLSLEARDALSLYNALVSIGGKRGLDGEMLSQLKPGIFFADRRGLLRQKDVLEYEAALKAAISSLLDGSTAMDSGPSVANSEVAMEVVNSLQDPILRARGSALDTTPSKKVFMANMIHLLGDLHVQGELPAILFNYDRKGCEEIGQAIGKSLQDAENRYKDTSPVWARKIAQWRIWQAGAKERERQAAEKQKKRRQTADDREGPGGDSTSAPSWEQSFDPKEPLIDFSFADYKSSYGFSELKMDMKKLRWGNKVPEWAFALLRRGIGVHHSGMNKGYRSLVEALFRRGFLRVVVATGTLALGINAPAKTTVFCADSPFLTALEYRQCAGRAGRRGYDLLGNVIFYGLPMDRVQRLMLSKLPVLGGGFPVTSTLVLRLCGLLEGSGREQNVVTAIDTMMSLPRVSFASDVGRDYLVHHVQFSIDYLRRSGLMNEEGKPMNLFAIASHLYYTEPSNLALVGLLRAGVLHRIFKDVPVTVGVEDIKVDEAKRTFILLMAHLFGRKMLPLPLTENEEVMKDLTSRYPSRIILPPMPTPVLESLREQAKDILSVFVGYANAFAGKSAHQEPPPSLPLSGPWRSASSERASDGSQEACSLTQHLSKNSIRTSIRSPFVANSGLKDDDFGTVLELADTVRTDIHLNPHAIPSLDGIIRTSDHPSLETNSQNGPRAPVPKLNGYLYDFYTHGQAKTIVVANGIRTGDLWYLIEDFRLTLLTVKAALEQLLLSASAAAAEKAQVSKQTVSKGKRKPTVTKDDWEDSSDGDEDEGDGFSDASDSATLHVKPSEVDVEEASIDDTMVPTEDERDDGDDDLAELEGTIKRPTGVTDRDWVVYRVVSQACKEFGEKAMAMRS